MKSEKNKKSEQRKIDKMKLKRLKEMIIEMSIDFDELGLEPTTLTDLTGQQIKENHVKPILNLIDEIIKSKKISDNNHTDLDSQIKSPLNLLFASFSKKGKVYQNSFNEIIFEISYSVREFDFAKISYDDTFKYNDPEQAPKKYTQLVPVEHQTFFRNTNDFLEMKCKLLEWLSRPAFKEGNTKTQLWYQEGINAFLKTKFTSENFKDIYCRLGNKVNRNLCLRFINSEYDMSLLKDKDNE